MVANNKVFVAAVDGWYTQYIPFYIYFINRAYPEADILIYKSDGVVDYEQLTVLEARNYIIVENMSGIPAACYRWLISDKFIKNYKYAYVGDVHIAIAKEPESLFNQHIRNMGDLPYSNLKRSKGPRLTGLHFIETDPYFRAVDPVISRVELGDVTDPGYNEELLYQIVKDSGLGIHPGNFRPHHGLHLGIFRKKYEKINFKKLCGPHTEMYRDDFRAALQENPRIMELAKSIGGTLFRTFEGAERYCG